MEEGASCAICLEDFKHTEERFTLSCGHEYHHKCFRGLVCQTTHSFVNCPLCRTMNCEKPCVSEKTSIENLQLWFYQGRCICKTKAGTRCKKKAVFLNNGCCLTHNRDVLPESLYGFFREYLGYVLESTNHWNTKVYMLDISRKLLINYKDISSVQDLQHYFLEYFHKCRYEKMNTEQQSDPKIMYNYYNLTFPPKEWIERSVRDKTLI